MDQSCLVKLFLGVFGIWFINVGWFWVSFNLLTDTPPIHLKTTISVHKEVKLSYSDTSSIMYVLLDSTLSDTTASRWLFIRNLEEVIQSSAYKRVDSVIVLKHKNRPINSPNNRFVSFRGYTKPNSPRYHIYDDVIEEIFY